MNHRAVWFVVDHDRLAAAEWRRHPFGQRGVGMALLPEGRGDSSTSVLPFCKGDIYGPGGSFLAWHRQALLQCPS